VRAWILDESPGTYRFGEVDAPVPGRGEVRVRVVASALNHLDLWMSRGRPRPRLPHIPGADGAGLVDAVGEGSGGVAEGDEVVVNPAVSCRRCPACLGGESPLCPEFAIVGEHRAGTHAEAVVVPVENVVPRPAARSWEESAAYGLATVTAWRMLRRARLQVGDTLLVVGVGGGVSSAGLVLGRAMGARVFATSTDAGKRRRAVELGAEDAFDSGADFPVRPDVVLDNVGAATWSRSLRALAPAGRLVTCGATSGPNVELSLPRLFFRQQEIIGSTMGSYREFHQVTDMVAAALPVVIDEVVEGLDRFPDALRRLEAGAQLGKIVVRHR
jgi:zinc-binding alcohol dehydrogenase/oxidoreductase